MATKAVVFWEIIENTRDIRKDQLLLATLVKAYKTESLKMVNLIAEKEENTDFFQGRSFLSMAYNLSLLRVQ